MRYILIGRLHIDDKKKSNNWKSLSIFLKRKIFILEDTKAQVIARHTDSLAIFKNKIKIYNQRNDTDFFIE